jgi:KUP system potassium uptake protein
LGHLDRPFGIPREYRKSPAPGIRLFEVRSSCLEVFEMVAILSGAGMEEKTIFYGLDEIVSTNCILKVFALIERLPPSFAQVYKLSAKWIHGVVIWVELQVTVAARPRERRRPAERPGGPVPHARSP